MRGRCQSSGPANAVPSRCRQRALSATRLERAVAPLAMTVSSPCSLALRPGILTVRGDDSGWPAPEPATPVLSEAAQGRKGWGWEPLVTLKGTPSGYSRWSSEGKKPSRMSRRQRCGRENRPGSVARLCHATPNQLPVGWQALSIASYSGDIGSAKIGGVGPVYSVEGKLVQQAGSTIISKQG